MKQDKRKTALLRAEVLKSRIEDYLKIRPQIPKGLERQARNDARKAEILAILGAEPAAWNDWRWQLKNRITDAAGLARFLPLTRQERHDIERVEQVYRFAISPHYMSLIDPDDPADPIRRQAIPSILELDDLTGEVDPMAEEMTNPAGCITRRYPDRLIINVTNECAMYCRHCQRRRNIGQVDRIATMRQIEESLAYIRANPEIRDVLITGGDPFTMPTSRLEAIISSLRAIPSVEIIRVGSRTPVTMPQRITTRLCRMLKQYHPLYVNTHFNHPQEVTAEAKAACGRLADAGIQLGNQAVLLNGVNDDPFVMRCLNQELLKIRVKPYYLFHAKTVRGTSHFHTSVTDGLTIMEYLRGYTSGLAIPYYIVNAPGGKGKTPLLPQYLLEQTADSIVIRTWENEVITIPDAPTDHDLWMKNGKIKQQSEGSE
ncbi:MAG: glutamate 2,3-aminomutase [bacterium]